MPRPTRWALGVALGWGAGLVVAALTVSTYRSEEWHNLSPNRAVLITSSSTLVGHDGLHVLAPVAAPVVVALLVTALLRLAVRGNRGAEVLAWILAGLLGAFNLISLLSIGALLLPVTVALLVACGAAHRPWGWQAP